MDERERRRETFDEVAELYATARRPYPEELIDEVVRLAGLEQGAAVVEIGCGTGQATRALAERGLTVTCVELGERLAAIARRSLDEYPQVDIVNADFECWEPPRHDYDAVVAFNSFHWLDPARRYELVARLLRPNGALAFVEPHHVIPMGGDTIFLEMQDDYRAVGLAGDDPPQRPEDWSDLGAEIEASGLFTDVTVRRPLLTRTYTADEFIALMDTASDHRLLPDHVRAELHLRKRRRIEGRPGGTVEMTHLAIVHVARRR
jgi:SAM-dependent methyltransferase